MSNTFLYIPIPIGHYIFMKKVGPMHSAVQLLQMFSGFFLEREVQSSALLCWKIVERYGSQMTIENTNTILVFVIPSQIPCFSLSAQSMSKLRSGQITALFRAKSSWIWTNPESKPHSN